MGKESERINGNAAGKATGIAEPPADTNRPGSNAGNTSASAAGAGNAPAAGAARPGTEAAEKKPAGLASLTEGAAPAPEQPKRKRRRAAKPKKKEEPQSFNAEQITALIVAVSTIAASRPGMSMFAISEIEAQQIATPLANMIQKSEKLAVIAEHSDAVALVTACLVIFIPRVLLYFDTHKKEAIQKNGGVTLVKTEHKEAAGAGNDRKPAESSARTKPAAFNSAASAIPSII